MAYACKIICDSINPAGNRLTTFQVTFPRIILAEVNTHRMLSRNSASMRAIPTEKIVAAVQEDPFIPLEWGANQKGMQATKEIDDKNMAQAHWLVARDQVLAEVVRLHELGVHKQIVNRLLEPFMWHTAILSATDWSNFYSLRVHPAAQPEFQHIAKMMLEAHQNNTPQYCKWGEWHLPYISSADSGSPETKALASSMRCARVTHLRQEAPTPTYEDAVLANAKLLEPGHMSPLEHPAVALDVGRCGNYYGWKQYRKTILGEQDILSFRHAGRTY